VGLESYLNLQIHRKENTEMRILFAGLAVAAALATSAVGSSAAVLFSDEFTSFVKDPGGSYYWAPRMVYPNTCEATTLDGRSALHMAYSVGINKGMVLVGVPKSTTGYWNCSITFKPVADAYIPMYMRVYSYNYDLGEFKLWLDTLFWGSQPNQNVFDVYDQVNGIGYFGPMGDYKLWQAGSDPNNWYTFTLNIGRWTSTGSLYDFNNNLLWKSTTITNAGTTNIGDLGMTLDLFAERNNTYGTGVDTYIDKVVITDDYVADVDLTNIAECKQQPNLTQVTPGGVVTQVSSGFFYIENETRTSGIRVVQNPNERWVGDKLDSGNLVGTMDTLLSGERCIQVSQLNWAGGYGDIIPIGMNNRSVGGGSFGDVAGGKGQVGVFGGAGLNNIGLLIRTWGKVTELEAVASPTWFKLDDGSGVNLKVTVPAGASAPAVNSNVKVLGVVSCERDIDGNVQRLVVTRDSNDVQAP